MSRFIWGKRSDGKPGWIPESEWRPTGVKGVQIIGDGVDVVSPITGERFDSKSSYYGHLKQHGCNIMESTPSWVREQQYRRKHGG